MDYLASIIVPRNHETEQFPRTTEQAEGGKAVGVDPALFTACKRTRRSMRELDQGTLLKTM